MGTFLLKRLDHFEQMADRPGQTIEPDDHEDFALRDLSDEPGENWPISGGAGSVFLMDDRAAGSLELIELSVCCLLLGRDAGVTDQALPSRGGSHVSNSDEISALCT